jgi:hypothetical protein
MHGVGVYVDADKTTWEGIFVDNCYQSAIQKHLKSEKKVNDKCLLVRTTVIQWFVEFFFIYGRSDKKSYKDNMSPFFGTQETCGDFITEVGARFEDRTPEKWNEMLKCMFDDGKV